MRFTIPARSPTRCAVHFRALISGMSPFLRMPTGTAGFAAPVGTFVRASSLRIPFSVPSVCRNWNARTSKPGYSVSIWPSATVPNAAPEGRQMLRSSDPSVVAGTTTSGLPFFGVLPVAMRKHAYPASDDLYDVFRTDIFPLWKRLATSIIGRPFVIRTGRSGVLLPPRVGGPIRELNKVGIVKPTHESTPKFPRTGGSVSQYPAGASSVAPIGRALGFGVSGTAGSLGSFFIEPARLVPVRRCWTVPNEGSGLCARGPPWRADIQFRFRQFEWRSWL